MCTAFLRRGRWNRTLDLPSLPVLSEPDRFWEGLLELCRRERVTNLRVQTFASASVRIPALPGECARRTRTEYSLDLQPANPWANLSTNHRRNIRAAERSGVEIRRAGDEKTCRDHARLIAQSVRRRVDRGEAASGSVEYRTIRAMVAEGAGELFQAVAAGEVSSSILVLLAARGAYYHSAGSTKEGISRGASHFLIIKAAEALRETFRETFWLGGADPRSEGLHRFKAGFGAEKTELEAAEFDTGGHLARGARLVARYLSQRRTRARMRNA